MDTDRSGQGNGKDCGQAGNGNEQEAMSNGHSNRKIRERVVAQTTSGRFLALLAVLMSYLYMVADGSITGDQALSIITLVIGYYFGAKGSKE